MAAYVNVLSTRDRDRLSKDFDPTHSRLVDPLRKSTTTWDYIPRHEGGQAERPDAGAGGGVGHASPPAARLSHRRCRARLSWAMAPSVTSGDTGLDGYYVNAFDAVRHEARVVVRHGAVGGSGGAGAAR